MIDPHGLTYQDDAGAEEEMSEFLYAFVRLLRPKLVVETGCYKGFSTVWLGQAVCDNKKGFVISCDTDKNCVIETRQKVKNLPVNVKHCSSLELPALWEADFLFCDSDYKNRSIEIGRAKSGCVVVIHDTKISHDSQVPPLEGLVTTLGGICFDTYRGFGILRRI